jgi:hypothetical protein
VDPDRNRVPSDRKERKVENNRIRGRRIRETQRYEGKRCKEKESKGIFLRFWPRR